MIIFVEEGSENETHTQNYWGFFHQLRESRTLWGSGIHLDRLFVGCVDLSSAMPEDNGNVVLPRVLRTYRLPCGPGAEDRPRLWFVGSVVL